MDFLNIAFYRFVSLSDLPELRVRLLDRCKELRLRGTILIAPEGLNGNLSGTDADIRSAQAYLEKVVGTGGLDYKESRSTAYTHRRMLVKIKPEIITFREPTLNPAETPAPELPPETLQSWLDEGRDILLIDTRNDYELEAGTFENAQDLHLKNFTQFKSAVKAMPEDWKKKTIVTFCTGGIRCEKAAPYMIREGFEDVYQLQGGILNYFKKCGKKHYRGDCFVFDRRRGVDGELDSVTPLSPEIYR